MKVSNKYRAIALIDSLRVRLVGILFFVFGLFWMGLGFYIILTSDEFQAPYLIPVGLGIISALVGVWAILRPESFSGWDTSGIG